jgi:hypothetical protein
MAPSPWTALTADGERRGTPPRKVPLDTGGRFIEVDIKPVERNRFAVEGVQPDRSAVRSSSPAGLAS